MTVYAWHREVFARLLAGRAQAHPALLLAGPAGIGKSALALALARSRLCEQPGDDGAACARCRACGWFDAGNHPDFRLLQPASAEERADAGGDDEAGAAGSRARARAAARPSREIRIEQVRALDGFLDVAAHRGGARVVVVDPADATNAVAANALLKRLEEPPAGAGFVLVTSRPAVLPATIRSRCLQVSLPLPPAALALAWLADPIDAVAGPAGSAAHWLAAAGGAPLHALRLASHADAARHRRIVDVFAALPGAGIVASADALAGLEASVWAQPAQTWVADLARVRAGAAPRRHPERLERLRAVARGTSLARIVALEHRLRALPRQAAHPLNARLLLEDVLLEFQRALA